MIDFVLSLFTGSGVWPYLAGVGAAIVGLVGVYLKGRGDARSKARANRNENDLITHGRMNHAETGSEMSDTQRAEWLRNFGDRDSR